MTRASVDELTPRELSGTIHQVPLTLDPRRDVLANCLGGVNDIAKTRRARGLNLAVLALVATLALSAIGLPPTVGGTPVAAAASCTKFFESDIKGIAADFTYGPQGRLWLTEGGIPEPLVRGISPAGGADAKYPFADPDALGMGDPQGIAVGGDGRLWIAGGPVGQTIAALDLSTGLVTAFALPGAPMRIAAGSDGNLWVTLNTANAIATVNTSGTVLATYPLAPGSAPFDITAASDGALWFTEAGAPRIGRITTTGVLTEYLIGAPAHDITASGTDIWFTERTASKVGHLTTLGLLLYEVPTPTGSAGPQGIAVGQDLGVWFTENLANKVGRLDPVSHAINETLVDGSSSPTEMIAIADGTIWFGTATNHVEHFKPNPDGSVGPLPPSIALTIGSPVQVTPSGPVYSTSTPFTIGGAVDQCLDNVYYRIYPAGSTPGAYTQAGTSATFTLPSSGTWTVDFYAVGPGGQTITQSVTLIVDQSLFAADTAPPVITTPGNLTAAATSVAGAVVTYTASALDAKDGTVSVTCTPASGSTFAIGTTTVTCTAQDLTGNLATSTFTVTVTAGAPAVTVPSNIVVVSTGATNTITFTVSAQSPWGGNVDVTCTPPGTTLMSPGTFSYAFAHDTLTTVTCVSAADGLGQRGSASFTVYPVTPPALSLPANITVTATGPTTPVTYTATATSGAGTSLPITCTPASGSAFGLGTTPVTCSSTDHGVTTTGSFTVTVNAPPPTITVPANITVVPATSAIVTYAVTAASVVDGSLPVTCVPPSGSTFLLGTTTVVCTTTDARGVTIIKTFNVTIVNTEPTTLTITSAPQLPQGATTLTVQLAGPLGAPVAGRSVTITVNGTTYAAVTGPAGTATLTVPLAPGTYTIGASFAGDTRWFPSTATKQTLLVYGATQFVIWGGNGVLPGQRVVFWGEKWWDASNLPEKSKVKDFKGWADTVNGTTWTTKSGNSKPPETIPTYISVIITSSIERGDDKAKIGGNIVGRAILRVDSAYKDEPGKPVYGVVVAVIP